MATFMMFGKYSSKSLSEISSARTKRVGSLIREHGGKVKSMYALLGNDDLVLVLELSDVETAMKVSLGLHKETGIAFSTSAAVEVKTFDKLAAEV